MAYEPRGKVAQLIEQMKGEPARIWSSTDVATAMEIQQGAVSAHLDSAIRHGVIFRRLEANRCQYSLKAFPVAAPAADTRAPQVVPGWTPPKMIATRPGSEPAARPTAPPPEPMPPAPAPIEPQAAAPHEPPAEPEEHLEDVDQVEEGEAVEADAFVSCRTGEIVLVGLEPDEDGRVTIPADLVQAIKAQIAWSPAR